MNSKPEGELVGYCLDSINENLKFVEKRLAELQEVMGVDYEMPAHLCELAEELEKRLQNINNSTLALPFK